MDKSFKQTAVLTGIVYFAQGALGIAGIALPIFLRNEGWSIADITVVSSLAAIPWVIKILYGLISDSLPFFGYRRKSYIILCSLLSAFGWLALVFVPPEKMWILLALLLANTGFAATDVITDGVVVEHSTPETSSFFQSISWGSRSVGSIFSGFIGGWLAAHWLPHQIFVLTMFLPLGVLIVATFLQEQKQEKLPFRNIVEPLKKCLTVAMTSRIRSYILLLVIISVSAMFGVPFFFFLKETLGFDETYLGTLASLGWCGALVGSFIYAKWLQHIPSKKILTWAILIGSLNIFSTLLIQSKLTALILIVIGGVLSYLVILPIMSQAAVITNGTGVEGTLFALMMGIYNLGQVLFGLIGGKIYPLVGLNALIILSGCLMLTGLLVVRKRDEEVAPL